MARLTERAKSERFAKIALAASALALIGSTAWGVWVVAHLPEDYQATGYYVGKLVGRPLLGLIISAVIAFAAKARAGLPAATFAAVVTLATLTSISNDLVQLRAVKVSTQRSDRAP